MIKFNLKNGGFTLLEALVAISILMVAVVAPITIAQKGLSSASYSKNQMIASYLAQDAIEYIINKKDEVSINNNFDWSALWTNSSGLFFSCLTGCKIDTINPSGDGTVSADSGTTFLSQDNTNGFYGYSTGSDYTQTNFTRQINLTKISDDEALITVTVSWGTDNVTVKTLIYNY